MSPKTHNTQNFLRSRLRRSWALLKKHPLMSPFVWVCQRTKLKFSFAQNISWSSVSPHIKLRKSCISNIQVKLGLVVKLFEELHKQYRLCNNKSDNSMAVAHTTCSSFTTRLTLSRPNGPIWGHSLKNEFSRLVSGIFDLDSKQLANGPKWGHSFLNGDSKQLSNGPKWGHCSKNSKNRLRANYAWTLDMKQAEMIGFRLIKFSGKTELCAQSYTRSLATTFRLLQQKHSCFGCYQPSCRVPNSM